MLCSVNKNYIYYSFVSDNTKTKNIENVFWANQKIASQIYFFFWKRIKDQDSGIASQILENDNYNLTPLFLLSQFFLSLIYLLSQLNPHILSKRIVCSRDTMW